MFHIKLPSGGNNRLKNAIDRITYRQWLMLAGFVSILFGLLVYLSLDTAEKPVAEAPKQLVKVVVAKQDIPERMVIKENMLEVIEVPPEQLPPGALDSIDSVVDLPALVTIQQGDIITSRKLMTDVKLAGFTGTIPPNCRAVSVSINDVTGVAGFAKPGDYVDVMVISGGKNGEATRGEIMLQNILLLGINKQGSQQQQSAPPANGSNDGKNNNNGNTGGNNNQNGENTSIQASADAMTVATLALTPSEALQLATAVQNGQVYLSLRPYQPADMITLDTHYTILPDKTQPQQSAPQNANTPPAVSAPAPQPPVQQYVPQPPVSQPSGDSIEIIRGTQSSRVEVQ